jgi:hypothetical protein
MYRFSTGSTRPRTLLLIFLFVPAGAPHTAIGRPGTLAVDALYGASLEGNLLGDSPQLR